jgi:membrane protease YdiL (CAAX protease family)
LSYQNVSTDEIAGGTIPAPGTTAVTGLALWGLIVIVSPASEIACQMLFGAVASWLIGFRIGVLVAVLIAGILVRSLRRLRPFSLAYLLQLIAVAVGKIARGSSLYIAVAGWGFSASEFLLLSILFVVIAPALWWCARQDGFFVRIGNLSEFVRPLSLRWVVVAPVFAVVSALCAWAFVAYTGSTIAKSWSMVPVAVGFAAINAFEEEFLNRSILIGAVQPDFGAVQAVLVGAFIFGIGHWNGLPAGVLGVLMTFALGAVTGTAMVQTKGMFWSWFMHFLPDCVLFYYWGIGSVAHATVGTGHL